MAFPLSISRGSSTNSEDTSLQRFTFRKVWLVLILLVCTGCALAAFLFRRGEIAQIIFAPLIRSAAEQGVLVSVVEPSISLSGLSAQQTFIQDMRFPLRFEIQELGIRPTLLSLFSDTPNLTVTGKIFQGAFETNLSIAQESGSMKFELLLDNLQLAEIPMIAGFGFRSLLLSAKGTSCTFEEANGLQCPIEMNISEFDHLSSVALPPLVTGLPLAVKLPKLGEGTLACGLDFQGSKFLQWSQCRLSSLLGQIESSGKIEQSRVSSSSEITLSPDGVRELGSWFQLMGARPQLLESPFRLSAEGGVSQPRIVFESLN